MEYNILIVGAGQLGSRYLQGLAVSNLSLNIFVYDINEISLDTAKNRWEEVNNSNSNKVNFITSYDTVPSEIDLAIISTTANVREAIILTLSDKFHIKNWVLEKVLTQSFESLNKINTILKSSNVWVNTFFRTVELFKNIKENTSKGPLKFEIKGGNWGLACNTIHILDFIYWWTQEKIEYIDVSNLDNKWFESKRKNFWEINGEINITFTNSINATLISDDSTSPFLIKINSNSEEWLINWDESMAVRNDGLKYISKIKLQSETTSDLVSNILINNKSELPTLESSVYLHKHLLESFLMHWNKNKIVQENILPIT
jgi:hypothetical protein